MVTPFRTMYRLYNCVEPVGNAFKNPPCCRALEPEGKILVFMWPVVTLAVSTAMQVSNEAATL